MTMGIGAMLHSLGGGSEKNPSRGNRDVGKPQ